ncbi:hypothetical protein D4R42_05395 [bacterium]|nr:MAG: hypothetical protein D4R42_05395 [bacterium]
MVAVAIYAVNSLDPYSRYWTIYKNGAVVAQIVASSGYTWTVNLPDGTYEFDVSQIGGSAYGTYSGTINGVSFSGVDYYHAVAFTVGAPPPPPPPAEAYGKIVAIRVQDIARNLWFNYDNGMWDKTPEVTAGANLYIAAYVGNVGDAGNLTLRIIDDTGATLATKTEYVVAGGVFGDETGTKQMPNRSYGISIPVDPGATVTFTVLVVGVPTPPPPPGEPAVGWAGIRALDRNSGIWYSVYPEGEQAKCRPGSGNLVVAYGARNIGTAESMLYGRILGPKGEVLHGPESSGVPILPGNIAFWEPILNMPNYDLALEIQVSTSQTFAGAAVAEFGVATENGELSLFDQFWVPFVEFSENLGLPVPPKPPLPALPFEA